MGVTTNAEILDEVEVLDESNNDKDKEKKNISTEEVKVEETENFPEIVTEEEKLQKDFELALALSKKVYIINKLRIMNTMSKKMNS